MLSLERICPNCLDSVLMWDSDADAIDAGYAEEGSITYYHCEKCGADIEVFVPTENPYKEGEE